MRALEAQLSQLECAKREIEQKLFSVVSTLRRIGGIQLDGSVNMPYRLLSPSRRWSPARGKSDNENSFLTSTFKILLLINYGVRLYKKSTIWSCCGNIFSLQPVFH